MTLHEHFILIVILYIGHESRTKFMLYVLTGEKNFSYYLI